MKYKNWEKIDEISLVDNKNWMMVMCFGDLFVKLFLDEGGVRVSANDTMELPWLGNFIGSLLGHPTVSILIYAKIRNLMDGYSLILFPVYRMELVQGE